MTVIAKTIAVGLLLVIAACSAPLVSPSFQVDSSVDKVHTAIVDSLNARDGWSVVEDVEGRVRAHLFVRTHQAEIDIHYSATHIEFEHLTSQNLDERRHQDGCVIIHRRYSHWLGIMEKDIRGKL